MKIGPFVKCPQPEMVEAIALAGFDFAVLDMEHTPLGPRDLYPLVLAAEARDLELVVRIPEIAERWVKWCLDLGVHNVQVPSVSDKADIELLKWWSNFAPIGRRGLCRFVRAADFSAFDGSLYVQFGPPRLILQIESLEAAENMGQLVEIAPEGSIFFFGPYDLSASMGVPGETKNERVVTTILGGIQIARQAGFDVGVFADHVERVGFWKREGVEWIEYGSDLQIFMEGAHGLIGDAKRGGGTAVVT